MSEIYSSFEKYAILGRSSTARDFQRSLRDAASLPDSPYFKFYTEAQDIVSSEDKILASFIPAQRYQTGLQGRSGNEPTPFKTEREESGKIAYDPSNSLSSIGANVGDFIPDYSNKVSSLKEAIEKYRPLYLSSITEFSSTSDKIVTSRQVLSVLDEESRKMLKKSERQILNIISEKEKQFLDNFLRDRRYWNKKENRFLNPGTRFFSFTLDPTQKPVENYYKPDPAATQGPQIGGLTSVNIPTQTAEKSKELISRIEGLKSSYQLDDRYKYSSESLAKILLAQRAIKVLSISSKQTLLLTKQDPDFAIGLEKAIETVSREINQNPDASGLTEAQKENLATSIKKGIKIRPQCILINNILELAKANRKRLNATYSDNQNDKIINYSYTRMVSNPENPAATINKLTKVPGQEEIMNLRPYQFARLFPYLRLYKVLTSTDKETKSQVTTEVEFKFPNATNVQNTNFSMDIFQNLQNPLTQEYGIKSFDWRFIGSDPFTYANDIEATLVIHFNDFEQLVVEREQNGKKYKILDLLTISEKEREAIKNKDPDAKFDIRVDVGWSGPDDPEELKAFDSKPSQKGFDVNSSIRTLFLTMTDYDISFNEEGHFELTINYKSRLEQSLYDKKTNILIPDESSKSLIEGKEEELEELRKSSDEQNIDAIRTIESELQELRLATKQNTYANLYRFLLDHDSIYTETIDKTSYFSDTGIASFSTLESPADKSTLFSELNKKIDALAASQKNSAASATDPTKKVDYFPIKKSDNTGDYLLNFFFLGDLVEALAQRCLGKNNKRLPSEQKFLDDTRIVLTDFLLYDPQDLTNKNILNINIGDIPISVELFMSFYYEKVVKFNVGTYSLMKFIRDLISYCIINIFQDCFGEENLKTSIKTGFMDFKKIKSSYKTDSEDPFEYYAIRENAIARLKLGDIDLGENYGYDSSTGLRSSITKAYLNLENSKNGEIPKIASRDERSNCIHALIISSESFDVSRLKIAPNYQTKREQDIESGLYHLDIGSAKGILKKINFKKTDQKYLREQRFTQDDASGFSILSNVFDVDISLFGNNLFFPGQRIFINLGERFSALGNPWDNGVDGNFANIMGLGGYHIVTSVENEISTSGFSTKINARWETSGDGKTKDVTTGAAFKLPAATTAALGRAKLDTSKLSDKELTQDAVSQGFVFDPTNQ